MTSATKSCPLLMLSLAAMFSACKKENADNGADLHINAEYYLAAKLDGQPVLYEVGDKGDVDMTNNNPALVGSPNCTFGYGSAIGLVFPADAPTFEMLFPKAYTGVCNEDAQVFAALFPTGVFAYGEETEQVVVNYWDGSETWSSTLGPQGDAVFEVTASNPAPASSGTFQKVSGKADCILYNTSGASKKLKDLRFSLSFRANF